MILITGATGHIGNAVIQQLLKLLPAAQVAGLARSPEKATGLKAQGVDIRIGDYNDKEALAKAMQGIDTVLLVSGGDAPNYLEQHSKVIDAAKAAGVTRFSYTGRSLANRDTLVNKLMVRHFETEDYIKTSGMPYTLFRNALYMDVLPGFTGKHVLKTGIKLPAGQGRVAYALRSEQGEAIANVLAGKAEGNQVYAFTGPEAWTFDEVAAALTALSGEQVSYTPLEMSAYQESLKTFGLAENLALMLSGFMADISNGQEATITKDLETALGRKPANLETGLKSIYGL